MNKKELQEKIYSMSNSFLPLDVFYNDIRDNNAENYDKEQAYKDIEIIADFIIDLQSQLDQQKAMCNELKKVNGILTDTIIEVTQNEFDLNKLCYLEEISAKFGEKMEAKIKELKK